MKDKENVGWQTDTFKEISVPVRIFVRKIIQLPLRIGHLLWQIEYSPKGSERKTQTLTHGILHNF